jgi:hypothetical protein
MSHFEVWVDAGRFIAWFHYPASTAKPPPELAEGHHRLASHCHYSLANAYADEVPYAWEGTIVAPRSVAQQIRGEFPEAHVRKFDGRRRVRMR